MYIPLRSHTCVQFSRLLKENEFHLRRTLDAAHATLSPTPATSIPPTLKSFNLPPAASFPIILSSYPRSGNTLLRSLFERFTLTPTGSDTTPTRPLSHSLSRTHSLVGEGITDSRVSLVKTHWPERVGHAKFTGSRVLLVVRNVWDAIDSYWNMCLTNTHTSSIADSVYEKYRSMYQQFAVAEAENWGRFIDYWMKLCKRTGTPLCVVRYEDLVLDPIKTMEVRPTRTHRWHTDGTPMAPELPKERHKQKTGSSCEGALGEDWLKRADPPTDRRAPLLTPPPLCSHMCVGTLV